LTSPLDIKFITGRDSTTLKKYHSNDIPNCDDIDNAFSNHLRCLNYPAEFINEHKKENHKKWI
jgi:hypothetical protein